MLGFDKKDIYIFYNDDFLMVIGYCDIFDDEFDKDGNIFYFECCYGQMSCQYCLLGVDLEQVNVKYIDGVLILILFKLIKQVNDGKYIEID